MNLANITGWPAPVADSKTVKFPALGTSGLTLVSGDLEQTVSGTGAITPIVLTADDSHILTNDCAEALSRGYLNGTGLSASYDSTTGKLTISGTPNGNHDFSNNGWPNLTEAKAVIKDSNGNVLSKYETLSEAIEAATTSGQTVEMKKNPTAAVADKSLTSGVTLKDAAGNTYKADGGNATVSVATNGKVTLTEGTLDVSANGAVDVVKGNKTYNVSSTSDPKSAFTVTTGSETTAVATIAAKGGKLTNGNGMTFTAGAANSTFLLDGSDLTGAGSHTGDAITVAGSTPTTIKVGEVTTSEGTPANSISVEIPGRGNTNTDAVTVTKGDGETAMATVAVAKQGDSFTVRNKTYVAAADDTEFTIDKDGNVKLTKGGISLGDGESVTGIYSNKTITNPASSNNDQVTVVGVPANGGEAAYDKVTVPMGGDGTVKIGDKTYANKSTTEDLVLKVTADGVSVIGGQLTETIGDGSSLTGITSGATIANPGESGDDTITVTSDNEKDRVTVPAGTGNKVSIAKGDETTEYTNGSAEDELVIDVTADDGAALASGSVSLDKDEAIGVNGNTITNKSDDPIIVKKNANTDMAVIALADGQSFTDKDGNTYTAKNGAAAFQVDIDGNIILLAGSATVEPAEDKTPTVNVRETPGSSENYPVSGNKPFTVTVGNTDDDDSSNDKATVTIPTKGNSVTSGNLTFTAGAANATFPLDGSELKNNGDSIAVAGAETNDVTVKVGTTSGEPATDINVTIPGANTGDTTITKGTPTIVTIGANGDTFKINNTSIPTDGSTTAGDQYAIDANGAFSKIAAKLFDASGNLIDAGGVSNMISKATSGQTVEMVAPPESDFVRPMADGVTLKDLNGNKYKANGDATKISVGTTGNVSLIEGKLDVTPAESRTASVAVAKRGNVSDETDFTTVSGEEPFTVTAGKGDGTGEGTGNDKATVTIPTAGKAVTVGASADEGLTFTAGTNGSTFPLDGKTLTNTGDSVTVGKNCGEHEVALGSGDNAAKITVPEGNTGATTVTKGQPAGFDGKVTLGKKDDTFKIGNQNYTAAEDNTTFAVKKNGDTTTVALVSGAVNVPDNGSIDVRADGWSKSVNVVNSGSSLSAKISVVPGTPAMGKAEVANSESVTIGGKTYKAAANDTAFIFDENGNVKLDSGKAELSKNDSVLGGTSGVEIKNTSADDATKVTVEKAADKDIVTVPAGGTVTIGGKEYTNGAESGDMKLEIDADGNVTLASGKADMGKDAPLNLNGTTITNTKAGSDLTMTKNEGGTGTLNVAEGGSFTVGTGTVKDPSADMSFTINSDGTLTANLPENGSVTINGVKYTAGEGGVNLTLDKDGNITSITGTYTATIPGSASYAISGIVKAEDGSGIEGATVKLTQGGKEVIRIAPVTTGADGSYTFPAVPAGTYNVVVEKNGKTLTQLVTVTSTNVTVGDLVLPTANVSSVVDVKPTSPVGAMVGGLDTVASSNAEGDSNVTITFVVSNAEHNSDILSLANGKTLMSLDFTVNKKVGGATTQITDTGDTVLEVILTFDTSNKTNITVYRQHSTGDGLETIELTKLDARPEAGTYEDGTYYVGNGFVVVYTSKFSDYAIGYNEVIHSGSGSSAKKDADYLTCPKDNTCPVAGFTDTDPKAWYHNGVHYCVEKGLMQGHNTGAFAPNDSTTRAQLVMILWRLSGSPAASAGLNFSDVGADAWYTEAIRWAVSENIAQGYGNGTFGPNDTVTREQMATILYRYAQSMGYDVSASADISGYADASSVSAYAVPAMQWACGCGMINGKGANTLDPLGSATRAESATMLQRFCTEIVK